MKIEARINKVSRILLRYNHARLLQETCVVSFSFDDVPKSALTTGMKILDKHNVAGTFYLSMSEINRIPSVKELLKKAIENDHEMACHTYGHLRMTHHSKQALIQDIERNQKEFNALVPDYTFVNFAYPFGAHNATAKAVVDKRFDCSRIVAPGINSGYVDLNRLKATKLYEGCNSLETIFAQVDSAVARKGWLIFYTHDVREEFSEYGCSPAYFEQVLEYCVQKDVMILPVKDALKACLHK